MKTTIKLFTLIFATSFILTSCGDAHDHDEHNHEGETHEGETHEGDTHGDETHEELVHLSEQQFQSLGMSLDTLPLRSIGSYVEANGQLEVPPQNEATVTAIIGANVVSIQVIEGDKVKKGQVLAYLSHPNLIALQTDYSTNWNQLQYLRLEYERQKKLYEEKVGSGREFQKIQAEYQSMNGLVNGYRIQLKMLGLKLERVQQGEFYEQVPITSPINGYVRLVEVKTGQFVQPETEMFEIVNIDHIHADLMVFEKDMHLVKEGMKVRLLMESLSGGELEATIFSVGKAFEQDPKAIHIHAEIENKMGLLIPGIYVRGQILLEDIQSYALPEAGVVREGDNYFIFSAEQIQEDGEVEWQFEPIEVIVGISDNGWVEVKLLAPLEDATQIAWNNAYYILAEMKKGEAEHSH